MGRNRTVIEPPHGKHKHAHGEHDRPHRNQLEAIAFGAILAYARRVGRLVVPQPVHRVNPVTSLARERANHTVPSTVSVTGTNQNSITMNSSSLAAVMVDETSCNASAAPW